MVNNVKKKNRGKHILHQKVKRENAAVCKSINLCRIGVQEKKVEKNRGGVFFCHCFDKFENENQKSSMNIFMNMTP